ncbi:MAG: hypothetical protein ACHRXM_29065 [Isosphaerales bacterium]
MAMREGVTATHRSIRPFFPRQRHESRGASPAMQDDVSRRSFLAACGAAGAAVRIGEASLGAAPPIAAAPSWVDRPIRWAQLTLVENDPGRFDLPFWLDYFRRTHSDAACLSAGGCVAYYPTLIPSHHRSRWLGDRDPFGEWQQQRLFELWRLWDAEVRKINPDSRVIPNAGGGATSPLDMKAIGDLEVVAIDL